MARTRPADRFEQLIAAATEVFIHAGGFRRTQIVDVAKAMGVAKGTLYLYVESKEALFDLVIRHADRPELTEPDLPVPNPPAGSTIAYLRERMAEVATFDALRAAAERLRPSDGMEQELQTVLEEIYATLEGHRTTIKLIGSSAHDLPELAELWYGRARGTLNRRLAAYLERRTKAGLILSLASPIATARFVTETASWFAVQRHWDPQPDSIPDEIALHTYLTAVGRALLPAGACPQ